MSQFKQELPINAREAVNHVHSSLQNCIERSFRSLKKICKILGKIPQFSVETQINDIIIYLTNITVNDRYIVFLTVHKASKCEVLESGAQGNQITMFSFQGITLSDLASNKICVTCLPYGSAITRTEPFIILTHSCTSGNYFSSYTVF